MATPSYDGSLKSARRIDSKTDQAKKAFVKHRSISSDERLKKNVDDDEKSRSPDSLSRIEIVQTKSGNKFLLSQH